MRLNKLTVIIVIVLLVYLFLSANCGVFHDANYKAYYLSKLPSEYVIPYVVITPSNIDTVVNNAEYPIILKPNRCSGGGNDVQLIKNKQDALKYLKDHGMDYNNWFISQKYVKKPHEYSILYEKHPFLSEGKVVAITEKIPVKKQSGFQPLNVGYTYRKCHIIDYSKHITDNISKLFDKFTRAVPKFYAGRYDVLADSLRDLLNGNFVIIELNGLMGVDHRSYINTVKELDIRNLPQQLRWYAKRIIIGLQANLLHGPPIIIKNIYNHRNTLCDYHIDTFKQGFTRSILGLLSIVIVVFVALKASKLILQSKIIS